MIRKSIITTLFFLILMAQCSMSHAQHSKLEITKWKCLGPISLPDYGVDSGQWSANGMGWIESLAVWEKKPKVMYAGSNTGGLYRTRNGGKTWKFAFDVSRVSGVTDIVLDSESSKKLWVATGTTYFDNDWGLGVMYSENGGKSWSETSLSFLPNQSVPLWCLERSSTKPSVFYACSETDIFKTSDHWARHEKVYDEKENARVHFRHLVIHKYDENKVVASGDKIMITIDGGQKWKDMSPKMSYHLHKNGHDSLPDRYAMCLNPADNNQMLVLYEYAGYDYIERSDDFGTTWRPLIRRRTFNRVDRNHAEIAWHPTNSEIIFVAGVRVYVSTDGSYRFNTKSSPSVGVANEMHDDIRELLVLSDGTVYTGNDGGVGVSHDNGETWQNLSGKGLTVTQFFDIAVDQGRVVGGCQDLSSMIYDGEKWKNTSLIYGDGGNNLIRDEEVIVMQSGTLRKGSFANNKWDMISVPFHPNRFNYPLIFSPFDTTKLWATDHHIWEYSFVDKHWRKLTDSIKPVLTKIVALDAHPNGVVYFAKDQPTWNPEKVGLKDRMFRGRRIHESFEWTDITSSLNILAWRGITDIVIRPDNPKEVFVSLYGYDNSERRFKVFKTIDGGESWVNISNGLPDVNTFCILVWKDLLFLGTDGGVYVKTNQDEDSWKLIRKNMPRVHITDLGIDSTTNVLYASTFGAGIWTMKLPRKLVKIR